MKSLQKMKLNSLQYLRAIAATAVVFTHASVSLVPRDVSRLRFDQGAYGVDLFFVISGFVMYYTTAGKPTTPGHFLLRRCIRIVPLYFLLTTFGFALAVFARKSVNLFSAAPADYVRSIFFIPYFNRLFNDIRPEISQGWTLNYEMFFYLVFACCLWVKEQYRVWACITVFVVLAVMGICTSPAGVYGKTYTNPIMLEFVFGVVAGYFLVRRESKYPFFVLVTLILTALCAVYAVVFRETHRVLVAGVPSLALVSGTLLLERRGRIPNWPFLVLLGDASYSLYLVHTFVLATLKRIFVCLCDPTLVSSQFAFIVCGAIVAIPVGIVLYKRVEKPMTKWVQIRFEPARSLQLR
jgi:exopolysaccharide production protein ExoZ